MSWKRVLKWLVAALACVIVLVVVAFGFFELRFQRVASRVYDVEVPAVVASADPDVIARGRHLAESLGNCLGCHGPGLGGLETEDMGPVGKMFSPNLTTGRGGVGAAYSDGELARAVRNGIRNDGTSLMFMPSYEFSWWPDEDLVALVSYVRSLAPVDNELAPTSVGPLGKAFDALGTMTVPMAELVDHDADPEDVPAPEPTARYGRFVARSCIGCHGDGFSGGRIPGTPPSIPAPTNLTPHDTGLAGWSEADFVKLLNTGVRPDGTMLDPFMPIAATGAMNDVEKRALWAYLSTLEPVELGNR